MPLFDRSLIPTQYDKDIYFQTSELPPISRVIVNPIQSSQTPKFTSISNIKFNEARIETDRLADIISRSGQTTYKSQLSVVKNLIELFAEKKRVKISPIDDLSDTEMTSSNTEIEDEFEDVLPTPSESTCSKPDINLTSDIISPQIANIRPQHREKFVGRPSSQTAIGKTRSRPKPSIRIRKNKHLVITSKPKSPAKKLKRGTEENPVQTCF